MMKKWMFVFMLLFFSSCILFSKKIDKSKELPKFKSMLNTKQDVSKIKLNGVYSLSETKANLPYDKSDLLIFFSNNICCYIEISTPNAYCHSFEEWLNNSKYIYLENYRTSWGVYKLESKIISFCLLRTYFRAGQSPQKFYTYYEGLINNGDSIQNWHLVEPIPNINLKFNDNFDYEFVPKTFYFVEDARKKLIDSNKAWVNRFKN